MDAGKSAVSHPSRWSELPPELWAMIGRRLDTRMDILRFRSVCSTWRSLLPRLPASFFPLSVPHPHSAVVPSSASVPSSISVATIFRLEPPPETSSFGAPLPSRKGWLIKTSEANRNHEVRIDSADFDLNQQPKSASSSARARLLKPLCRFPILYKQGTFPEHLDLLNLRVTEVCKEYALRNSKRAAVEVEKVLISPDSPWRGPEDTAAIAIDKNGTLHYWKFGQQSWTIGTGGDPQSHFDDIIVYKRQFYAVDNLGTVSWIDSSTRTIQFSPPMCGGGDRKHLIESDGDIFVVDRYCDGLMAHMINRPGPSEEVVDFRVYRLDQEWGKWDEVRDLGDVVFFLGSRSSFSVSVRDFEGCPGNCIYFVMPDHSKERVHVFSLANRSIKRATFLPEYLQIMWPPPSWISPIPCVPDPNVPTYVLLNWKIT